MAKTSRKNSPSNASVQEAIGHAPVVLDIEGLSLNADDRRRLKHPLTGGLIRKLQTLKHGL